MLKAFFKLDLLLPELCQLPRQIVCETFLFLLIVLAEGFLFSLQSLYLLQERVADVLLFLFRFGLLSKETKVTSSSFPRETPSSRPSSRVNSAGFDS